MLGPVLSPTQFKVLWTPFLNLVHAALTVQSLRVQKLTLEKKKKPPAKIYLVSVA